MDKYCFRFIEEIKNCQKSQHKNVIQIFGAATWPGSLAIVMEYLPGCDLASFIEDQDITIGNLLRLRLCHDIAGGLAYLHSLQPRRIIHGDLKPENVLLTEDLHCKIADFGSSVSSSYTGRTTTFEQGSQEYTLIYAAPELLLNSALKRTPAIDVYSFSIIIYIVLRRELPTRGMKVLTIYRESILNGQRPYVSFINDQSSHFSDYEFAVVKKLEKIMQLCWSHSPLDRPSMVSVNQQLLQLQANVNAIDMVKEVALALDGMTILDPVRSNYRCAPLDKFLPPYFELLQPGEWLRASERAQNNKSPQISLYNV